MDFWESVSLIHNSVVNLLIAINGSADCLLILLGIPFAGLVTGELSTGQVPESKWS